jgi:class 3 adenylate cyclase
LQTFRDLFANEALRPGEQISVGSLTVVFTDLRDSTRLYSQIGDAPAFGRVMNHFDILEAAIAAEGGAIVKTIGDAVMAVFRRPLAALQAVINAQHNLHLAQGGEAPLSLKAGIHTGACIAVTLNERLDYFGSTVNIAARLAHLAAGGDIVLSNMCADQKWLPGCLRLDRLRLRLSRRCSKALKRPELRRLSSAVAIKIKPAVAILLAINWLITGCTVGSWRLASADPSTRCLQCQGRG